VAGVGRRALAATTLVFSTKLILASSCKQPPVVGGVACLKFLRFGFNDFAARWGAKGYWLGPPWTGSVITLDWATAVGLSVALPQDTFKGRREKSTIHPSRL